MAEPAESFATAGLVAATGLIAAIDDGVPACGEAVETLETVETATAGSDEIPMTAIVEAERNKAIVAFHGEPLIAECYYRLQKLNTETISDSDYQLSKCYTAQWIDYPCRST